MTYLCASDYGRYLQIAYLLANQSNIINLRQIECVYKHGIALCKLALKEKICSSKPGTPNNDFMNPALLLCCRDQKTFIMRGMKRSQ